MPNNTQHIPIPRNTWVDLYDLSGITPGDPLYVENVGVCDIYLAVQLAQPEKDHDAYNILKRDDDIRMSNTSGDDGAWAFCNTSEGLISISTTANEGFWPRLLALLADAFGNPIGSLRGSINVHDSDPHRAVFNQFLHFDTATTTTLGDPATAGSNQINLTSAAGFAVDDEVKISNGVQEPVFFNIRILVGTLATLDTPLTFNHPAGADVTKIHTNLAEPGITAGATLANPVLFTSHIALGAVVHITNMTVIMTDTSAMDFTTFGGAPALDNGVVFRAKSDGFTGSFTNWKANLDLDSDAFPVRYQAKVGGGEFGLSAVYQIKGGTGAVIYLDGSLADTFEALAQESLELNTKIRIKLQGHFEGL